VAFSDTAAWTRCRMVDVGRDRASWSAEQTLDDVGIAG
jgi:hypothetical protein